MTTSSITPSRARSGLSPAARLRGRATQVALYGVLIVAAIAFLLPFYWMILSSVRPKAEYYALPMPLFPRTLSLENYQQLFERSLFGRGLLNSTFLAIVSVILQVAFCSLAGYTFAKLRFRGREALFIGILTTLMIPSGVGLIPNFIIMARIHWIDTYLPLIVPGIANAFGIFWMRQYCLSLSDDLLDAARIDGAGEFSIYWRVVLPIITPALASLAIFVFLGTWNDFLSPLVFLRSQELFPVQLWLTVFAHWGGVKTPAVVMAGSVLASIPVLVLFATLQRYFIAGLTAGSVK